jgi:hypothetical protein
LVDVEHQPTDLAVRPAYGGNLKPALIAPGVDFAEVITQAGSSCQVLLAVISPGWLTATDQDGRRRLDNPDDLVRLEIAAALARDIGDPDPGRGRSDAPPGRVA